MLYVDTGCLLKLYYPEPNSAQVAAAIAGEELCWTALHELELTTGLQLKVFRGEATSEQTAAVWAVVEQDVDSGKLQRVACDWPTAWREARELTMRHSAATGCRSLDALHCALVVQLDAKLLSTNTRQVALALVAGIAVRAL